MEQIEGFAVSTKGLGLLAICCWLPSTAAMAQQPPQAGDSLRILEDHAPALPAPADPVLQAPTEVPVTAPQSDVRIPVQQFRIQGNRALPL